MKLFQHGDQWQRLESEIIFKNIYFNMEPRLK